MNIPEEVLTKFEDFARLPKLVRAVIFSGFIGLFVAGYYFGIHQGVSEELAQLRAEELELERRLSGARSVSANLDGFKDELQSLEGRFEFALRRLPNQKQIEVLLTDISNLGKTVGVEIKSFRRKPEQLHDFYAEVPLAIELEGTYHDVARFFDRMSKLSRIVNMGELEMNVGTEDADGTRVNVSGTAVTFRFIEKV